MITIKNEIKPVRIMFAGASGTGKTTLAKYISEDLAKELGIEIPFVSGSVSDLLPQTRNMPHKDMLARSSEELAKEDFQILNLRNKLFNEYAVNNKSFVSDRSFLDSAAYFIYKQADKLPQCEIEHFLELCLMCLVKECTHLIFIPFDKDMFKYWVTEDNNKRILSKFFQMEISSIMDMVLDIWDLHRTNYNSITRSIFNNFNLDNGFTSGTLETPYGKTRVITVHEINLEVRQRILKYVLEK